jgi:hypothetical protein
MFNTLVQNKTKHLKAGSGVTLIDDSYRYCDAESIAKQRLDKHLHPETDSWQIARFKVKPTTIRDKSRRPFLGNGRVFREVRPETI